MNILIHRSIINELLRGNEQAEYLLRENDALDLNFFAPDAWLNELSERIRQTENRIPPFISELVLHTELYITIISSSDYHISLQSAEQMVRKTEDVPYFAVILYLRDIDRIWSNEFLSIKSSVKGQPIQIYNTAHLSTSVRKWRIFTDEGDTESQSGGETTTNTYNKFGEESDFHWMTDNRLDPMLYQRFLHFYGLRCLNDDKIYYLDPDPAENKLALPSPKELERSTPVWIIERIYLDYEDYYEFDVYKVLVDIWKFYWELFIHETETETGKKAVKFEESSAILEKDNLGLDESLDIIIKEEESIPPIYSDAEPELPKDQQGIDLFTTNTGLIDTHPEGLEEMPKEKADKYLGVDTIKLGKDGTGLRIGDKVFGISVINALAIDVDETYFVAEDKDKLKDEYDFYFEKEDSNAK